MSTYNNEQPGAGFSNISALAYLNQIYCLLNINTSTWSLQEPYINLELSEFCKGHAPKNVYAVEYNRVMDEHKYAM